MELLTSKRLARKFAAKVKWLADHADELDIMNYPWDLPKTVDVLARLRSITERMQSEGLVKQLTKIGDVNIVDLILHAQRVVEQRKAEPQLYVVEVVQTYQCAVRASDIAAALDAVVLLDGAHCVKTHTSAIPVKQ